MTKEQEQELENEYIELVCKSDIEEIREILNIIIINPYKISSGEISDIGLFAKLFSINALLGYDISTNYRYMKESLSEEVAKRFILNKL